MSEVKIRIHEATANSRYGDDFTFLFDDPITPKYQTEREIEIVLQKELGYTEDEFGNGYLHDDIEATFEYNGYIDVAIPDSIVNRIRQEG